MHHSDSPDSTDNLVSTPQATGRSLPQMSQRSLKLMALLLGAIALAILLNRIRPVTLFNPLQDFVFWVEEHYQQWFSRHASPSPLALIGFAFLGGLIASISPCILALLPVNLSYIGTRTLTSRRAALQKAIAFVLGVVTVLSLLGLVSSLASLLLFQFQGYIYGAVGLLLLWMGLHLWGWVPLRLPQWSGQLPIPGAYGVGFTFALVTSPCTSPFLFSVLGLAATTGSSLHSVITMVSYALGYTAILFAASVITGFAKQTRALLPYAQQGVNLGAAVLVVTGLYYLVSGFHWFIAMVRVWNG
jgi:cytochrome c-type biogenesis protein